MHVGRAEVAAWEALPEMEKFHLNAGPNEDVGVSLIVDQQTHLGNCGLKLGREVELSTQKKRILRGYFAQ